MEEVLKVGDRILVKTYGMFGGIFNANIVVINKRWWWFNNYVCEWMVNDYEHKQRYGKIGILHSWNIIGKN